MSGLREIRNRIHSTSTIMQITAAMRMVSAAKLKKAQDDIGKMGPYAEALRELLWRVRAAVTAENTSVYAQQRTVSRVLIVVITANRGLCGAFNSSVVKATRQLIADSPPDQTVSLLCIGKKGYDAFKKTHDIIRDESALYDLLCFQNVEKVAAHIMNRFVKGDCDRVDLVYNKSKNIITQALVKAQILPMALPKGEPPKVDYIYEPGQLALLEKLIPKALKSQLFKAILDSTAAEHAARMTAMYKATDNAKDLQAELKRIYNKARQAAITKEISEIVSGVEALSS